ncbi:MAG: lipopolysaccharide biosynthesis glycosyltransferase [Nitrospirae bacterium]|nr:MAG: lipopolysaccharide biosynthesis glycosyltransferase [Nitrospirota bacterium]
MNGKVPVSVAIVTKNEERNIRKALQSVRNFAEIVVIDSFSEDKTLSICREYTDRVYQQEWKGFARQKQDAIDRCSGEWILLLDADECVTPELKEEIISCITRTDIIAYQLPRKNFFLGRWIRHSGWFPDYIIRLFRKDSGGIEHREVHEKIVVNGSVGICTGYLEHYTYHTLSDYVRKMELYSTLSAKEMVNAGKRASVSSLVFSPLVVFIKMLVLKQGFRDGRHGFLLAVLYAMQSFLKYAKARELQGGV